MKLQLKTDGLAGENLAFVEQLNNKFAELPEAATKAEIEAAVEGVKGEIKNFASKADMESATSELKAILAAQGEKINEMTSEGVKGDDWHNAVKKGLDSQKEAIKTMHDKSSGTISIAKVATIINTGNFGAGVIRGYREPGISTFPDAERFIFNLISVMNGGPGSNPLSWINRIPKEGGAGFTAESATKPMVDWTYTEGKAMAEFLAVHVPVTRQALLNMPMLEQEINDELLRTLYNVLDYNILRAGTGVSPSINSIWQYAKAFNGIGQPPIQDPNIYDVLRVAIGQVQKGDASNIFAGGYAPSAVVVSIDTATRMDLEKDNEGRYLLPPFTTASGQVIKGVRVYPTKFLADDEFVVGEMRRYLFNIVDGVDIQVGWINDQFIKNELTLRAELYGMGRVKLHDTFAFVKGSFENAIAILSDGGSGS